MNPHDSPPQKKTTGIYKILCTANGKVYIGQSVDIKSRWKQHKSGDTNKHLRKDLVRYGLSNFEFSVIEECHKSELNEREEYWIEYFANAGRIYNVATSSRYSRYITQSPPSPFMNSQTANEYDHLRVWLNVNRFIDYSSFVVNHKELPQDIRDKTTELIDEILEYMDGIGKE